MEEPPGPSKVCFDEKTPVKMDVPRPKIYQITRQTRQTTRLIFSTNLSIIYTFLFLLPLCTAQLMFTSDFNRTKSSIPRPLFNSSTFADSWKCTSNDFICRSDPTVCVQRMQWQDGITDCPDGSDECSFWNILY